MTATELHMLELASAINDRRADRALERINDNGRQLTPTPEQAEDLARIAAQIREASSGQQRGKNNDG